jgi:hypothetical protein
MAIFEGTFKAPVMGLHEVPIKITGLGRCELTSDGLMIQGFKQMSNINSFQLGILFFAILFAICGIQALWTTMPSWLKNGSFMIPFLMTFIQFTKGQGTDHQGESIELFIPWEYILGVKLEKGLGQDLDSIIIILVKKFRYHNDRYEGGLFFYPSNGIDPLLDALQDRGFQCKR